MTLKRIFDIGFSLAALVAFAPLLILISFAVLIDSGWPILFSQVRLGRNFAQFRVHKFRSMRVAEGLAITTANDSRVTRVGRVLRKTKLDELPQLWNVLTGSMSLVGPRPELPQFVAGFPTRYERILSVRPGLTDQASLRYWNEEQILTGAADPVTFYIERVLPAKLDLAESYVRGQSFPSDCKILFQTAANLFTGMLSR